MAEIELKNITKIYPNGFKAIENLSLTIKDKEFMVLVGPSGCGKSTALRIIAGLESVTDGQVMADGKEINTVPPRLRNVAMVFQNYALYPHMNVYENMAFPLKMKGMKKREIREKVMEAAKTLEIEDILYKKPSTLSGGQRQRAALGRAIVREPDVFLFDEPLSNIDAKLRTQMRIELINLHSRLQTTFIYVTHDQTEAMTMGQRITVMKDGCIMQTDAPADIYGEPMNMFAAGFIGSPQMNFIRDDTRGVVAGIRPEKLRLADGDFKDDDYIFQGCTAEAVELLGAEMLVYFEWQGLRLTSRIFDGASLQRGDTVNLYCHPEDVHLFDAATERRVNSCRDED